MRITNTLEVRLSRRKVNITASGCYELIKRNGEVLEGYGQIKHDDGTNDCVHRVVWKMAHGVIPKGMYVCHSCDNPPCIRLEHLFLGTPGDNTADMMAKGRRGRCDGNSPKTHCPANHEYTKENTYTWQGMRHCKMCRRERAQKRRRKRI